MFDTHDTSHSIGSWSLNQSKIKLKYTHTQKLTTYCIYSGFSLNPQRERKKKDREGKEEEI